MKLNPEDFQCVKKLAGGSVAIGPPAPTESVNACDHVWVHLNGQMVKCCKCGVQPSKVGHIQDALQTLQEKKDVIESKKNGFQMFSYVPLPTSVAATQEHYYNKKFVETLKAKFPIGVMIPVTNSNDAVPLEVPKEEFKGAGDAEMFVKKIAVMSNLHVDLQSKGFGRRKQYRLHCDKCGQHQGVETEVADRYDYDHPSIAAFCKVHRHDPEAREVEGRKFRE